ncbi:MAG: M20/M25/M40 family metallo-hydrolase [Deltaproteobacteria bacterium]|nr:M20/M25/M40 family metallo-hydrolase [Deltaproteobacteria bacterium]
MSTAPTTPLATLAAWGTEALEALVAIDSSSNEHSATIPSSEGQRVLSRALAERARALGFTSESDAHANLIVRIPPSPGREGAPKVALMAHMDTSHGTSALPRLTVEERWSGGRVPYAANPRLHVDAETYPLLRAFVGDDLLHGPGDFPFGLDDKLGIAEMLTLARLLSAEPGLSHGELLLVFRPDEEIGRMEAVQGLAKELAGRGVAFGYTIDGLEPFEVNVENFDAAKARVTIAGRPLASSPRPRHALRLALTGVNTHGATAKSEGYLNATIVFARALAERSDVVPLSFVTDPLLEANAVVELLVDDGAEGAVLAAFERVIGAAARRGAELRVLARDFDVQRADDAACQLLALLQSFLLPGGPTPLLAEDSDGRQGYTNPHRALRTDVGLTVDFRLRDFDEAALAARTRHVEQLAHGLGLAVESARQYVNMGPVLARFPDLPRFAEEAARAAGVDAHRRPIRGGTGVDPFLAVGVPIANLGTGYFAPESEKELTSKQNIARHVVWLAHLVQRIAG